MMEYTFTFPEGFDPDIYLDLNPDVRAAGVDPAHHYMLYGCKEGRPYHHQMVTKRSTVCSHTKIWDWVGSFAAKKDLRVLEIGSRAVISDSKWKHFIPDAHYTGFDVLPGPNVDVVGDAHYLSEYFEPNSFDLVISFAVFEHLAMPWIVAEEISKILDTNGHVCIETHFSFSEHELPWHFFQFNSNALEVLFCKELGFENIIDSGMDNPIIGVFAPDSSPNLRGQMVPHLYCHSAIIAQKSGKSQIRDGQQFDWRAIAQRISSESMYPKRK